MKSSKTEKVYLVTGGAGFIGAWLLLYLHEQYPQARLINVDKLTYAANPKFLATIADSPRYVFEQVDICDRIALSAVFARYKPDTVIHLAAESHVDNSIANPSEFIDTNIVGTFNLLQEAKTLWLKQEGGFNGKRFHHVSTDEVYGTLPDGGGSFSERSPYAPNSPYAASKAGSDLIARAFFHTYGLPLVTTNCSNNFGPNQNVEKLIPKTIKCALAHQPIPVYGTGNNVRDWLFVGDHCRAIDLVCKKGRLGETYVIGTRNEIRNIEMVRMICKILQELVPWDQSYNSLITFVTDRLGHDHRYAIDPTKIQTELGWQTETSFESDLRATVSWYLKHPEFFRDSQGKI